MHLQLTDDELAVHEVFAAFFDKECPPEVVRAAQPLGHDDGLWRRLCQTGAPGMAVDPEHGGGGATFVEAGLAVQEAGRRIAPVPLIEHVVAARLLAAAGAPPELTGPVVDGAHIATVALHQATDATATFCPAGAVAHVVVALDGDELVAVSSEPPGTAKRNTGDLPLADRNLRADGRVVVATGDTARALHADALVEWKALMSVALTALGEQALAIGREYVMERHQFGVPVGSFQSLQHGLADSAVGLDGSNLLAQKALWAVATAQPDRATVASMALLYASEAAMRSAATSLQYHGGYGYAEEYDIQLYYRRAKAWVLQYDDPSLEYQHLATRILPS
ncbi:MAG: acyl-CoA/acyl-ACP dehydrogenase [Acidimicrobiales bacterium]|nr:acyl-CoA/acyl-ACP dehydrogenase [Acidimicrobiales bacterium]